MLLSLRLKLLTKVIKYYFYICDFVRRLRRVRRYYLHPMPLLNICLLFLVIVFKGGSISGLSVMYYSNLSKPLVIRPSNLTRRVCGWKRAATA